jgi:hypothetical protein
MAEIEKRADSLPSVPSRHLLGAGSAKPKGARLKQVSAMHSEHANLGRSSVRDTKKDCMKGFRQADSFSGAFSVIAQGITTFGSWMGECARHFNMAVC